LKWEDKVKNFSPLVFTGLRQRMHKFSHVVKKDGGHVATCLLAFQRAKAEQYSTSSFRTRVCMRACSRTLICAFILSESSRIRAVVAFNATPSNAESLASSYRIFPYSWPEKYLPSDIAWRSFI